MGIPYVGEIRMAGFNFPPKGWALCNGQILSIMQNPALFSILGITYGGDGVNTFGLPDLRSRIPVNFGQGPGLSPYRLGQVGGEENHTLLTGEMPSHNHTLGVLAGDGDAPVPANNTFAASVSRDNIYSTAVYDSSMNVGVIAMAGANQPHANQQPYLVINFMIALQGIYPPRG